MDARLARQLEFLREIDKLKGIVRRTWRLDDSRYETDAEHSWHLAMMAVVLGEHASEQVDLARVIRMVLVHDLVEIDAGDAYPYDPDSMDAKPDAERQAARRVFGLLPDDQAEPLRRLWEEFEVHQTPEARFANAIDRLQPLWFNYLTEGREWRRHGVRVGQVREYLARRDVAAGSAGLHAFAEQILDESVRKGYLRP
ncbi:MAG: HD domain-containing protein [Phycisphaerae bacterium]